MTPLCTIFRQFAVYFSSFTLFRFQTCMNIDADMSIDADERATIQKWISKWKGGLIALASTYVALNFSSARAELMVGATC